MKCLSCCLKSYSTLDRQNKVFNSKQEIRMNVQMHQRWIATYLFLILFMCEALGLSDFKVVDWFQPDDSPNWKSVCFNFAESVHISVEYLHLPLGLGETD